MSFSICHLGFAVELAVFESQTPKTEKTDFPSDGQLICFMQSFGPI